MNKDQKKKIDQHMGRLVRETNFELLFEELVKQKMFNLHMQNEIKNTHPDSRTEFMYNYIKTRGPDAYPCLVLSLYNTGHRDLAFLFHHKVFRGDEAEAMDAGTYGANTIVRKAKERKDLEKPAEVYHMGSRPRGLALIINTHEYVNNIEDPRVGSDKDVSRLSSVLQQLDYKVIYHEHLDSGEVFQVLNDFVTSEEHRSYDSCIVVMMAHGTEKVGNTVEMKMYDGSTVNTEDVVSFFYNHRAKNLAGKPKMFFFQSCRGESHDHAVTPPPPERVQTDGGVVRTSYPRCFDDILMVFPSAPGTVALRDVDNGAWMIQELCTVLCEKAWSENIIDIVNEVDRNIRERYDPYYGKQTVCFNSVGFSKKLYFNPGLYD